MVARFSFRDASEALNNNCVASVLTLAFSISCSVIFGVRSRTTPAIAQAMSARVFRAQPSAHVLAVSTSTLLFAKVPSNTHISRAGLLAITGIHIRKNPVFADVPRKMQHFLAGCLPPRDINVRKNPAFRTRPTQNGHFWAGFLGSCSFLRNRKFI